MTRLIRKVAVLGAGTMGARIAAHLANAGVPSLLLDVVPGGAESSRDGRNRIAEAGLEAARKSKPAAFFAPELARLVRPGNFDDDLKEIAGCDWIVEAVVEDLEIKRNLLKRVEAVRRAGTLTTTNTSGLPLHKIAEGFGEDFRRHFFGTHFFNPPRYMRLLELIPTPEADEASMEALGRFCDIHLGKGVVRAKDTPNFIANRIGTFSAVNVMNVMQKMELTIEEVDALTGDAVGWPRSATFRTTDLVGLDVLWHVARNSAENIRDERSDLKLPAFVTQMMERKWLGDKTGGGFYRKQKGSDDRLALDWKTLEYRARQKPRLAALEMAKNVEDAGERLRMLLGGRGKEAQFLWETLSALWNYAANRVPEIAESIADIDRAMKLGFNWQLGPFELWDAAGVRTTVERMSKEGMAVAPNAERLLRAGHETWYSETSAGRAWFDPAKSDYRPETLPAGVWSVGLAKTAGGVAKKNPGASLVDLGDGVGCIEFHSKMNALGGDIVQLTTQALRPGGAGDAFDAFVITNDAQNFSAGANIMQLLLAVQEGEWDEVDFAIRQFQGMTQAIKFCAKPVVVAPFGMALGGGCEIALHAAARQPHAELYMGLVEVGVGLLPGGGGCKEMLLRAIDSAAAVRPGGRAESVELMEALKRAFEIIGMAKVSTSAAEARGYGFLGAGDRVTMNRERVLNDAKRRALELASAGYEPPAPREIAAPGESMLATLKLGVYLMREAEYISDHDVKVGNKVAEVLSGGAVTPGTMISEQYVLDLEREGFKSLCGERKTLERIQYTLKTGKPLRN
ncbi:MAG: enoyl-CoA hydratase/isomerase family protein [Acidobacteria bacterium]|nr:enoyl-CoA hydratase/isomerase family protein [Acidobacteriota bacterium]